LAHESEGGILLPLISAFHINTDRFAAEPPAHYNRLLQRLLDSEKLKRGNWTW